MSLLRMEGTTPKQERVHNVQGLTYTLCDGEEKRQQLKQESRCVTAGSGRSCGREDNPIMVKRTADQSYRELPGRGRSYEGEDSPVSVIFAASKHLSHPSSACTSMEHPLLLHHSKIVSPPGVHCRYSGGNLPSHETAHYTGLISERVQQAFSKSHELNSASKRECNLDLKILKKASQLCNAKVMKPWPNYSTEGRMEWLNLQEEPALTQTGVHTKVYEESHNFASSPDDEEAEGFSVYCSSKDQDEESVIDFFPSANRSSSALQLKRRSHDGVVNAQEKGDYGDEEEDVKRVSLQSRRWGVKKMNKGGRHDGITAEEAEKAGTRRSGSRGRVSCSSKWGDAERWLTCGRPGPPPLLITNGLHFIALPKADVVKYASENSKEPKGRLSEGSHREAGTESGLGSMRDIATQSTPTDWSRCDSPSEVAIFSTADEKVTISGTCPEKGTSVLKVSPPRHNTPARRSVSCSQESAAKPCAPAAHASNARKLNLLELENCHLDKLKLARDLPLGTSSTWQLCPDEDIDESLKSIDHKTPAYESAKNHQHAKVNMLQARVSAWEEVERAKHVAKFKREEAKIEAWESLQRAEADAELRKLEVKLEKLRFEGREKIMGRLASAQRRAQEMRSAAEAHEVEQLRRVGMRANHIRKSGHLPSSTFNVVCSLTTKIKPTSSLSFS